MPTRRPRPAAYLAPVGSGRAAARLRRRRRRGGGPSCAQRTAPQPRIMTRSTRRRCVAEWRRGATKRKSRGRRAPRRGRTTPVGDDHALPIEEQLKAAPPKKADGEGVSYVDGRAVVDRSQKRIAKLARGPPAGAMAWVTLHSAWRPGTLHGSVAGSATAPAGGSVKQRVLGGHVRHLRRAGC